MQKMEQLIHVDANDKIIRPTTKTEAHEKGLIHRVAAIFLFNHKGELLLQHRREDCLVEHSVGRHVRLSETYYQAVQRELLEELGIESSLGKIGKFLSDREYKHYFTLFKTQYDGNFQIDHKEVIGVYFQSISEIAKDLEQSPQKYTQGFIDAFNFYVSKIKAVS